MKTKREAWRVFLWIVSVGGLFAGATVFSGGACDGGGGMHGQLAALSGRF